MEQGNAHAGSWLFAPRARDRDTLLQLPKDTTQGTCPTSAPLGVLSPPEQPDQQLLGPPILHFTMGASHTTTPQAPAWHRNSP